MEKEVKIDLKGMLIKLMSNEQSGIEAYNFIQRATNSIIEDADKFDPSTKRKYIQNEVAIAVISALKLNDQKHKKFVDDMFAKMEKEVSKITKTKQN